MELQLIKRRAQSWAVWVGLVCLGLGSVACATLGELGRTIGAPRFSEAPDREPELRVSLPSATSRYGAGTVRLWIQVSNPNPFSLTVDRIAGTVSLEGSRAAEVDFPLGLPLQARADTVTPLDLVVDFADVPGLGQAVRQAIATGEVAYQLEGTVGISTPFGDPVLGPMQILAGTLRVR
jgi:hypothetical protein